jgi:hypothetical protein
MRVTKTKPAIALILNLLKETTWSRRSCKADLKETPLDRRVGPKMLSLELFLLCKDNPNINFVK